MLKSNEIKRDVFELVRNFYNETQIEKEESDRINYAGRVFDQEELLHLIDSSLKFWLTHGEYCNQFEKKFAEFLGVKYSYFVNSGSSANLLAFMTLTSPLIKERKINRGDEIITLACGFPTTISPIVQYGAIPVFVDIELETLNIDIQEMKKALSHKTKAVMIAHTLGNPFNIKEVKRFCDDNNLWLIEDNCFVANTRIPTKEGVKRIYEIKKGDKLFGFDGVSFKETTVQNTFTSLVPKEDILAIKFENGITVRCTKDHPFYINGEWIKAKDLKIDDEVYHSTTSEYLKWRRTHNLSDEARKKMSDRMKIDNPSFNSISIKNSSINRKHKKSHIEKKMIEVIEKNNLPIKYIGDCSHWVGSEKKGFKNADFIFEDKNILFEVYDPTFKKYSKKRDEKWEEERYDFFKSFGYHTEFIKLSGWVNKQEQKKLANKLRKCISNGIKIKSIKPIRNVKKLNLQEEQNGMVRVYNLKCSPYNNFCLMGGILVHNCDALGSKYYNHYTGTFGDIATSSFYPPHHITTGEGGMVYTDNKLLAKIILSMRDWGRDCSCNSGEDNKCGKRFSGQFGTLPYGYDHKYVYSHFGYNLKATEMQAAIGLAQLNKLEDFIIERINNKRYLFQSLYKLEDFFILPSRYFEAEPSWFGFWLTLTDNCKFTRNDITKFLENNNIQTRNVFAGNIIRHPCFMTLQEDYDYRVVGYLKNTNKVMNDTFWIGVYPGLSIKDLNFMVEKIKEFIEKH